MSKSKKKSKPVKAKRKAKKPRSFVADVEYAEYEGYAISPVVGDNFPDWFDQNGGKNRVRIVPL